MATITSRELSNSTQSLLDRVQAGETLTITVDGRPMAVLAPVERRRRWISSDEFASAVLAHRSDAALSHYLEDLAGEMTDDVALS
jgi:prevent-host-death family protein